jgi:hypothetical protein
MALSTVQRGQQGQAYAKKETTFGTVPSLAATNAFRHQSLTFPGSDVKNKRAIIEKQQSPFALATQMTDGRTTAGFNLTAVLRPSGTINTKPELDPFLECGFGTVTNVALSTTVSNGTGAVGGATLASATGLSVGGALLITCPDGKKRVRIITAVNTGTGVTAWAPNLPGVPADGAAVKSALVYKFSLQNLLSFSIAHYLKNLDQSAGLSRVLSGGVADKCGFSFDANDDPIFTCSGAAKLLDATNAPSQPGGFTMVGSQPPSGITGELVIANTVTKFMKCGFDLTNALKLRNESYGASSAEESYRMGRADIGVSLDLRAETQTLYDLGVAGTNAGVLLQTGYTEGNIICMRAANVLFQVPDTDDPDDEVNFPFKGKALESSDSALDALTLVLA